jgi:hypothetical protein
MSSSLLSGAPGAAGVSRNLKHADGNIQVHFSPGAKFRSAQHRRVALQCTIEPILLE